MNSDVTAKVLVENDTVQVLDETEYDNFEDDKVLHFLKFVLINDKKDSPFRALVFKVIKGVDVDENGNFIAGASMKRPWSMAPSAPYVVLQEEEDIAKIQALQESIPMPHSIEWVYDRVESIADHSMELHPEADYIFRMLPNSNGTYRDIEKPLEHINDLNSMLESWSLQGTPMVGHKMKRAVSAIIQLIHSLNEHSQIMPTQEQIQVMIKKIDMESGISGTGFVRT